MEMILCKRQQGLITSFLQNVAIVSISFDNNDLADVKTFSGKANDVWALGVTLYALIYNELPFWADTEMGLLEQIHKSDLKLLSEKRRVSDGLKRVLLRMLDKDPLTRITLDELKKDKWLNEGFAVSLDSKEADYLANVTEDECKRKGISLTTIVMAVRILCIQ